MATTDKASKEYNVKGILTIGEKLYLNEVMADFHFDVEFNDQHERIPAHKLLLATASDVFRTMLNEFWLEKDEAKIGDASPSAFKEFLQFIYLNRVKVTTENVVQVMNMGKKYDIPECLDSCQDFLMNTLTKRENMCMGYELAALLENKPLMEFCESKIQCNAKEILSSSSFLECDRKVLGCILQMDWLSCSAAEVNEACMSWVKSVSNQEQLTRELVQEHLGDLFYKIPFGSMPFEEFAAFDRLYRNIFTLDEHGEIIQMIASKDFQPEIFSANSEMFYGISTKWNEDAVVTCDRKIKSSITLLYHLSPYYIKNIETTTFSTNKSVLLGAIICEHLSENEGHIENILTKITITETNGSSTSTIVYVVGTVNLKYYIDTRIPLPNPILIKPGFIYKIQMEQDPPADCCTFRHLKSEVEIESGITVKFHYFSEGDGKVMRGLVQELEFNLI